LQRGWNPKAIADPVTVAATKQAKDFRGIEEPKKGGGVVSGLVKDKSRLFT